MVMMKTKVRRPALVMRLVVAVMLVMRIRVEMMIVRLLIIGRRGRLVSCRLANVTATAGHHHTAHGRRSK